MMEDEMIRLNSETRSILESLSKSILTYNKENVRVLIFKTPNIFYKRYHIYETLQGVTKEITESLSQDSLDLVKLSLGQLFFNYFINENKQYGFKYYKVHYIFNENNNKYEPSGIHLTNKL